MIKILGFFTLLLSFSGTVHAVESDTVEGGISHVNHDNRSIIVSNEDGRRHTYFVGDDAGIRSGTKSILFDELKRGQEITGTLRHTDTGPEVVFFYVESVDELIELIPVTLEDEIEFSGKVTGVRPRHGTLTIRDAISQDRQTFNVDSGTYIHQANGSALELSQIRRGDEVSLRYHQTEEGMLVLTALLPARSLAEAQPMMASAAALPKTASSNYAYLMLALGFATLAALLWGR